MKYTYLNTALRKVKTYVTVVVTSMLLSTVPAIPVSAAISPVSVTLAPNAGSVQQGGTVQVTVSVVTSGTVSAALIGVNYDASRLTFQSADYTNVELSQDFGSGNSAGRFTIDRYKLGGPYPTGTFVVARLTFVASGSGAASFSVDSASTTISSGDPADNGDAHAPLTAGSGSVTINVPTPAPTTTQAPSAQRLLLKRQILHQSHRLTPR